MHNAAPHPTQRWFLGVDVPTTVRPIARRFRELLLTEANSELNTRYTDFVPWMAVRSRRQKLAPLFSPAWLPVSGGLLIDRTALNHLVDGLVVTGRHELAAIVPYDIDSTVLTPDESQIKQWAREVDEGKQLLSECIPWMAQLYTELILCIVPIRHHLNGRPKKRGFSTPLAFGAIFLSFEDRVRSRGFARAEMATDLAHELGHHLLHLFQSADRLIESDLQTPVYSGVRKELRPAIMSLHASAALAAMISVTRSIAESAQSSLAEKEFAREKQAKYTRDQLDALRALRSASTFTPLGERVMREFEKQVKDEAQRNSTCFPAEMEIDNNT